MVLLEHLAEDWPEWRGKGRSGIWTESGVLDKFPEKGLTAAWRVPIHGGFAGPAVVAGRVFVTDFKRSAGKKGTERALCLDEKSGKILWTREWAAELAPHGVRVNAVIVAECWTPMYASWLSTQPDPIAARQQIEARIPLGRRMTTGEEIAQAVAFLLSDRSSHTTGQLLHVDGGYVHLDRGL